MSRRAAPPRRRAQLPPIPAKDKRTRLGKLGAAIGIVLGGLYLLNPGAGVIDLIPDVLPIVGNLDEAGATTLVLWGLSYFGLNPFWQNQQADDSFIIDQE